MFSLQKPENRTFSRWFPTIAGTTIVEPNPNADEEVPDEEVQLDEEAHQDEEVHQDDQVHQAEEVHQDQEVHIAEEVQRDEEVHQDEEVQEGDHQDFKIIYLPQLQNINVPFGKFVYLNMSSLWP